MTRARKIQRFLSQPNFVAEQFTGTPGEYVKLEDTIKGFQEILDGKHDELPEQAFYMVGTIEKAVEKGRKLSGDEAPPSKRRTKGERRLQLTPRARESPSPPASVPTRPVRPLARDAGRPGVRGRGGDDHRPRRGGRDRRPCSSRAADRDAEGRLDARVPEPATDDMREFATGAGFFKVEQDRAHRARRRRRPGKEIDDARAREQLETAQRELELLDRGESNADRWQLEQRIKHAENQLAVSGRS